MSVLVSVVSGPVIFNGDPILLVSLLDNVEALSTTSPVSQLNQQITPILKPSHQNTFLWSVSTLVHDCLGQCIRIGLF
jgi:hypothetical protein